MTNIQWRCTCINLSSYSINCTSLADVAPFRWSPSNIWLAIRNLNRRGWPNLKRARSPQQPPAALSLTSFVWTFANTAGLGTFTASFPPSSGTVHLKYRLTCPFHRLVFFPFLVFTCHQPVNSTKSLCFPLDSMLSAARKTLTRVPSFQDILQGRMTHPDM